MTERKRLHLDVTDLEALKAKFPTAVQTVTIVKEKEDHSKLYSLAKAYVLIGLEHIPGVRITLEDGTLYDPDGSLAAADEAAKAAEAGATPPKVCETCQKEVDADKHEHLRTAPEKKAKAAAKPKKKVKHAA